MNWSFLNMVWCRGMHRSDYAREENLIVCFPTELQYWGMWEIQAQQNCLLYVFKCIVLRDDSVLTAPNDVLSAKFLVLLWSFLQQLKAEYLWPNSHAWYSPDKIRIATKNETKQTRHHWNMKCSLLINPTSSKQWGLRFFHCTVRFVLIMTFIVKWLWIYEW